MKGTLIQLLNYLKCKHGCSCCRFIYRCASNDLILRFLEGPADGFPGIHPKYHNR